MNYRGMFAMRVDDEDKKLNGKTSSSFGQRGVTIPQPIHSAGAG